MNISQYKKSMDEINVKKYKAEDLIDKNKIKLRPGKWRIYAPAYIIIGILFCNLILFHNMPGHSSNVIITAYAAEKEIQLTNDFVDFNIDIAPVNGGTSNGKDGYLNSNIYFKCEGQDIKSITYTCSDQMADRSNWDTAPAYYVENMIIPIEEYSSRLQDDDCIYGYYAPGEGTANITKIIGNSYTVTYEEQNNKQYGLIIAASIDDANHYHINDTLIKIDIHFNNGSTQHKKLIIKSGKDAFSGIQLRML